MIKNFQINNNQSDEIFDIVDSDDCIIGKASRALVHAEKLMHRSSHILIFNTLGDLFLQKRALIKDESPGLWDSSAAGHVEVGENYLNCAKRELKEELNISAVELFEVMSIPAQVNTFWEHVRVYRYITDAKVDINKNEISEGRYFKMSEINIFIKRKPYMFTLTFNNIYENYLIKNF
jgi:isopentenyldiphosphate isomerase